MSNLTVSSPVDTFLQQTTAPAMRSTLALDVTDTKETGAVVNGSTDDTASVQAALDTKNHILLSSGVTKITDVLSLSTIGQIIQGTGISNGTNGSLLTQTVSGKDGLHFYTTSDTLPVGGGGVYFSSLRDFSLRTTHANTGIGIDLGNDPTHSGDYTTLSNLHLMGWGTGLHLDSMAMTRAWNLVIAGDMSTPSDYGILEEGGSNNSHVWAGLSIAHTTTGFKTTGGEGGNVILPGDFGSNGTHFDFGAGSGNIVIGGDLGEGYTDRAFKLQTDSGSVIIQPTALDLPGTATNEPILIGVSASLVYIGTTSPVGDRSVMQFYGTGHVSLSPTPGIDSKSNIYNLKWHQSVFPSLHDDGVPAAATSNRGAIFQKIARSGVNIGDGFPFMRKNASDAMVVDDLANGVMLEQTNTWNSQQTFGNTSTGTGGLLVQNVLSGGDSDQRGAFVSMADRTPSPSENVADLMLRVRDFGSGEQVLTVSNRDGSVNNRVMTFGHGSATGSGYVAFTQGIHIIRTITTAGTTGAQTINQSAGSVNFAAAATSLVVTNSFVNSSSIIVATVATNDTTAYIKNVVASSGSFTINLGAAATAETRVNFIVTN